MTNKSSQNPNQDEHTLLISKAVDDSGRMINSQTTIDQKKAQLEIIYQSLSTINFQDKEIKDFIKQKRQESQAVNLLFIQGAGLKGIWNEIMAINEEINDLKSDRESIKAAIKINIADEALYKSLKMVDDSLDKKRKSFADLLRVAGYDEAVGFSDPTVINNFFGDKESEDKNKKSKDKFGFLRKNSAEKKVKNIVGQGVFDD